MDRTDTAHHAWEERWRTAEGRADWEVPEPEVLDWSARAYASGARRALDLGCGVGRHVLPMARLGFAVTALDASETGLAHLKGLAAEEGLSIETTLGLMTELPYEDAAFDFILSYNVIYHGDEPVVRRAISEIRRTLKPGGLYQGTMLTKRNKHFGKGTQIAPDTFIRKGEGDKTHPHFYCDAAGLANLFTGFEPLSITQKEQAQPGSWHWTIVAERLP